MGVWHVVVNPRSVSTPWLGRYVLSPEPSRRFSCQLSLNIWLKMPQQLLSMQGISATGNHIEEQADRWVREMGQSGRFPAALLNQLQQTDQLPKDLLPLVQSDVPGMDSQR